MHVTSEGTGSSSLKDWLKIPWPMVGRRGRRPHTHDPGRVGVKSNGGEAGSAGCRSRLPTASAMSQQGPSGLSQSSATQGAGAGRPGCDREQDGQPGRASVSSSDFVIPSGNPYVITLSLYWGPG